MLWQQPQLQNDTSNLVKLLHALQCSSKTCMCTAGDDEDAREEVECPDLEAAGDQVVKVMPSGSAAKFWEGLLKDKHEQLLKEEEQQVQHWHSNQLHHTDTSPPLDAAGQSALN